MKVSVLLPFSPSDARAPRRLAELVADGSADRLWMGHSFGVDSLQAMAAVAGSGLAVPCGLAVGLVPVRTSYDAALQARSAAVLTGHPFVLGLGIGNARFARAVTGRPVLPSTDTVQQVREVRTLLDGGTVGGGTVGGGDDGDEVEAVALLPLACPPVEVGAGVLRARHAEAVGAVADAAITFLAPRDHLTSTVIPALERGAAAGGRPVPRIVSLVHVALDRPGRDTTEVLVAGAAGHVALPHYRAMLDEAGAVRVDDDPGDAVRRLVRSGDLAAGSLEDVVAHLADLAARGVDEVVLHAGGVGATHGMAAMLDELRTIASAWRTTDRSAVQAGRTP